MEDKKNNQFYASLVAGEVKRNIVGLQKRFSYENIVNNPSVQKYLFPFFGKELKYSDVVCDYGCGAGTFLPIISTFCKEVHGFDVVLPFIDLAKNLIKNQNIKNAYAYDNIVFNEIFKENCFDAVFLNDVLHHMEDPQEAIFNAHKLLKPEGKLIIVEPNRLNPAIFIFHALDSNERKLLKLGRKYYEKICEQKFKILRKDWFPLVYGPSSKLVLVIAEICERFPFKLLRWGDPRLFYIFKVNK